MEMGVHGVHRRSDTPRVSPFRSPRYSALTAVSIALIGVGDRVDRHPARVRPGNDRLDAITGRLCRSWWSGVAVMIDVGVARGWSHHLIYFAEQAVLE